MGGKLTALTKSTYGVACNSDTECYAANDANGAALATTADAKKVRCCKKYQQTKTSAGSGKSMGDLDLMFGKAQYGYSTTVGEFSFLCDYNYPETFKNLANTETSKGTWDSKTNLYTAAAKYGSYAYTSYCDGGAQVLAIAASAAAVSLSMW